ncbi:CPBP family intramembrane glutamic endopeptidase [Enterococcus sp. DIV0187]|uniref:CPBP family intramembrane glutamic endopeptidase n=1 Tax=Enterococcus sp. DIV0187 TaxID=2774644 RepID=UPI003F683F1B
MYQFLTFYLFKTDSISGNTLNPLAFLPIWFSQIMLGGGLEEAGWRGYLQPALEERFHTVLSTLFVGMIWSFWHLPYFLIQGNSHTEGNFIFYSITAIATAYTLTALYKLSNSVLICTLFHGWQNAIVMTVPANMGNVGFIGMFVVQIIFSVFLCVYLTKRGKFER